MREGKEEREGQKREREEGDGEGVAQREEDTAAPTMYQDVPNLARRLFPHVSLILGLSCG